MGFLNVCSTALRCSYLQTSKLFTCDCSQCQAADVARSLPCPACVPRDQAGLVPDASLVREDNRWADGLPTIVRAADEVRVSEQPGFESRVGVASADANLNPDPDCTRRDAGGAV